MTQDKRLVWGVEAYRVFPVAFNSRGFRARLLAKDTVTQCTDRR